MFLRNAHLYAILPLALAVADRETEQSQKLPNQQQEIAAARPSSSKMKMPIAK
jgi:hypothetical protein